MAVDLEQVLIAEIRRRGPLGYDEVVDLALYHPEHGFYASGGEAGRRGDFLTSPEVGPLFGAVLARALDAWWDAAGRPAPFRVVEAGAGTGTLARAVLVARPRCGEALRYLLVERSARFRAAHREIGDRRVSSQAELPAPAGPTVVLANELLDNLAPEVLARTAVGWDQVHVGLDLDLRLREQMVPARPSQAAVADALAPDAPAGARIPYQRHAARWLEAALAVVGSGGRVIVIDYAATTPELAARPAEEWLRTYAGHRRGGHPLADLGRQDITCDVCVDQLARVRAPDVDRTQSEFLADHGIGELVVEARRVWAERAHLGDLEALAGRSRVGEAAALTDPRGLGTFRVLEWNCPPDA